MSCELLYLYIIYHPSSSNVRCTRRTSCSSACPISRVCVCVIMRAAPCPLQANYGRESTRDDVTPWLNNTIKMSRRKTVIISTVGVMMDDVITQLKWHVKVGKVRRICRLNKVDRRGRKGEEHLVTWLWFYTMQRWRWCQPKVCDVLGIHTEMTSYLHLSKYVQIFATETIYIIKR